MIVKNVPSLTRPFLKWAGGKLKLVPEIKSLFPSEIKRYIEPFVGAGSVFLNVDAESILVNDKNKDLINSYYFLQTRDAFIDDCYSLFTRENNTKDRYIELRDEFNLSNDSYRRAVLFIYLNRHCFNGLCRYNKRGYFNTPVGKYDNPYFPEEEMRIAKDKLINVNLSDIDFKYILDKGTKGDVIYCDPPYFPLSPSASFSSYSSGGFNLQDQIDLARLAKEASLRGAKVFISNHYTKESYDLYHNTYGAKIITLEVKRTISSKVDERKPVKELIAIF